MSPTDEEIQAEWKALKALDPQMDETSWTHGAHWALQNYGLNWKKPEEGLPNEGEWIAVYRRGTSSNWADFDFWQQARFRNSEFEDAEYFPCTIETVIAWARVPLPLDREK